MDFYKSIIYWMLKLSSLMQSQIMHWGKQMRKKEKETKEKKIQKNEKEKKTTKVIRKELQVKKKEN